MPKIDVVAHQVDFLVFVSPAINWMAQSNYMTELRRSFAPDSAEKMAAEAKLDALIENGGSYADYVRLSETVEFFEADDFSAQWWQFAVRNAGADMTPDLAALPDLPILLIAGALTAKWTHKTVSKHSSGCCHRISCKWSGLMKRGTA